MKNKYNSRPLLTGWLLVAVLCSSATATQNNVSIVAVKNYSDYFASVPVRIEIELTSELDQEVEGHWSLKVNSRTWTRRSFNANLKANEPSRLNVEFDAPPVEEGIVLESKLEVEVEKKADKSLGRLSKSIWFFTDDPFHENAKWLKQLDITIADPVGNTTNLLESLKIPFRRADVNATSIEAGMLIIGEGANLDAAIEKLIMQAIAAGRPVLCLAPTTGRLEFGTLRDSDHLPDVCLHNLSFVNQLDERLSPERCHADSRCNISIESGKVVVQVDPVDQGWEFVELRDTRSNGRLIVCCAILRHDASPTPVFLLAHLFSRLCPNTITQSRSPK